MNKTAIKLLQDLLAYGHVPVALHKAHQRTAVAELEGAGLVRVFTISGDLVRLELRIGSTALHHFNTQG